MIMLPSKGESRSLPGETKDPRLGGPWTGLLGWMEHEVIMSSNPPGTHVQARPRPCLPIVLWSQRDLGSSPGSGIHCVLQARSTVLNACVKDTLSCLPSCLQGLTDGGGRGRCGWCWEDDFPVLHCGGWGSIRDRASLPQPCSPPWGAVGVSSPLRAARRGVSLKAVLVCTSPPCTSPCCPRHTAAGNSKSW